MSPNIFQIGPKMYPGPSHKIFGDILREAAGSKVGRSRSGGKDAAEQCFKARTMALLHLRGVGRGSWLKDAAIAGASLHAAAWPRALTRSGSRGDKMSRRAHPRAQIFGGHCEAGRYIGPSIE